jgi:hypothetical protein
MAITTLDGYIAAPKQTVAITRNSAIAAVLYTRTSGYNLAGNPGAGVLAGTSTTAGVLVTSNTAGFPRILDRGAVKYYLTKVSSVNTIATNVIVQDLLYKAGGYTFNANVTLSAQPSIAGRVPDGTDFTGVSLYFECVTAFTGIPTITVTYTNQDGVAGRTTGATSLTIAPVVGKVIPLPLQSGDSGIQRINSVVATVATAGTFNLQLVRDLFITRLPVPNYSSTDGLDKTGMVEVFQTSALNVVVQPDLASTGVQSTFLEISAG